ncbi:MAG: peptide ABC transporter permease [Proteobacteria bacterium]|nr:MAG: peptide ABC transporter permease [Pseudomonadota bacterium]
MQRCFTSLNFSLGLALSAVVVIMAGVSFFWTPYSPTRMDARHRLEAPSLTHPLGTDQYGRDTLSRVMAGAANAIAVGSMTVAIGMGAGILLGLIGAWGNWLMDEAAMRICDLLFSFPAVLSAILITTVLGPSVANAMLAIGIYYIPVFARLTRASTLSVKELDYIEAARAAGQSEVAIVHRHVLPNILSPLIIQATVQFAVAILAEAGLSYLGLGTQPPHPSWGGMLNEAQTFMELAPWMAIFPGLAIAWAVLGFNLLGDGLRDVLDPRLR